MDRMQIALKLGMDVLGISVIPENYQQICDAVYFAGQKGVCLSQSGTVMWDNQTKQAYSPMSHEDGGYSSRNLLDDILEIRRDIKSGLDDSGSYELGEQAVAKLKKLKSHFDS